MHFFSLITKLSCFVKMLHVNIILTNLLTVKAVIIDYTAWRALCSHSYVLISLLFRQRCAGNTFEYAASCNAGLKSV